VQNSEEDFEGFGKPANPVTTVTVEPLGKVTNVAELGF